MSSSNFRVQRSTFFGGLLVLATALIGCGAEERPAREGVIDLARTTEPLEEARQELEGQSEGSEALDLLESYGAPPPDAKGLLVAISKFELGDGKPIPKSELLVLMPTESGWIAETYEDPESNVFHKAMAFTPTGGEPGVLTLGGTAAAVKLWRKGESGRLEPVATYWEKDFGGKFSRMRDAEVADLFDRGRQEIVVATHDQGVVALISTRPDGSVAVKDLDFKPDTFVHEIEIGDVDGDDVLEVYATPSDPNKLDGKPQHGEVVRYVPSNGNGRTVVADLGSRHAKEILVHDVDGDGTDELYVSIEAAEGGNLEIRRYEAGTDPAGGAIIATLEDPMARFLTPGDVEGDGEREMVVAAKDTGLWLLRPGDDPNAAWSATLIDANSKGFEHAAILTDLDGDGSDELYVASDDDKEIRRYVWNGTDFDRETIHTRTDPLPILTWNIMPVPVSTVR